jgi:hypothetical protein
MEKRQILARARGYGPDYVASFVEKRKKDMREYARRNHIPTPFSVWEAKHLAEREERMEEERARKAALEEQRAVMQGLNDNIVALCARGSLQAFLFLLLSSKYNIITLQTCCILYMKGLDALGSMMQMLAVHGTSKTNYRSIRRGQAAPLNLRLCWRTRTMTA